MTEAAALYVAACPHQKNISSSTNYVVPHTWFEMWLMVWYARTLVAFSYVGNTARTWPARNNLSTDYLGRSPMARPWPASACGHARFIEVA